MQLQQAKSGKRVEVKKRVVPFSFWPTVLSHKNRYKTQDTIFSLDPWSLIERNIVDKCPVNALPEAQACLSQARDFFSSASQANSLEARPLSLYYSYMNLVKSYCLTKGFATTFDKAQHGLTEKLKPGQVELEDAFLKAFPTPSKNGEIQNFAAFLASLTGKIITTPSTYDIGNLLPQVVAAHRLWCAASENKERFVPIESVEYWHDENTKHVWLRIFVRQDSLNRYNITRKRMLEESGLDTDFVNVKDSAYPGMAVFEQSTHTSYPGFVSDALKNVSQVLKTRIWTIVTSTSPYRKHYLYLCPPNETAELLPQLAGIYALSYYLGSITRYRPHHLPKIVQGTYGPCFQDFITGQPMQFLYLMASEFAEQEIAKPGILI